MLGNLSVLKTGTAVPKEDCEPVEWPLNVEKDIDLLIPIKYSTEEGV